MYNYKKIIFTLTLLISIIIMFIFYKYVKNNYTSLNEKSQFSLGVNIHFVEPNIQEVKKLRESGVTYVRMDLIWSDIEKQKKIYNFSQYDKLVKAMNENNIRILFILDYSNPLYDDGFSPYSDAGRKAFANFAKQAVKHYKGKQIIWEIWNEPNFGFWKPSPNVNNYLKLALETIQAIKSQDKSAFIVAPAVSGMDYSYLSYLGKNGLFQYINAISVHPYRRENPETVIGDYNKLRAFIDEYPHNKNIQIFSGEWGYSTSWEGMNDMKQAEYCIRQYLTNIMCGVNLSIWYDWEDGGIDKNNAEYNFGTIYGDLTPKPTYYAIKTMTTMINGYKYIKRVDINSKDDYILMFKKGNKVVYAVWTTGKSHNISINLENNNVEVTELMGKNYRDKTGRDKYNVNIDGNVKYISN